MTNENELIQRLMVSKKIMEKHGSMPRGGAQGNVLTAPMVESYDTPTSNYNLPSDLLDDKRWFEQWEKDNLEQLEQWERQTHIGQFWGTSGPEKE